MICDVYESAAALGRGGRSSRMAGGCACAFRRPATTGSQKSGEVKLKAPTQYGNRGQTCRARRKRNLIPAMRMSKNRGWPGDRRGRLQRALVRLPSKRGGDNRAVRSVTSRRLSGSRRLDQAKRGHGQQSPDRVALGLDRARLTPVSAPMDHFGILGGEGSHRSYGPRIRVVNVRQTKSAFALAIAAAHRRDQRDLLGLSDSGPATSNGADHKEGIAF